MDDGRREELQRLHAQLSDATARRDAAARELKSIGSWVGPIREAFGRPFFYSGAEHGRPENADKSAATYTGSASHDVVHGLVLPAVRAFKDAERDVTAIRERLAALGEQT